MLEAGRQSSPDARSALAELCRRYWPPVYAYIRRRVTDVHEAQDLTQEFFARMLENQFLPDADPNRGRFRTYLLTFVQHFLANEWKKARTQKRGGGKPHLPLDFTHAERHMVIEPEDPQTPEHIFNRNWTITLIQLILTQLRDEYQSADKLNLFEHCKPYLAGPAGQEGYTKLADQLDMSVGAVRVVVHRMRGRYQELMRKEISRTTSGEDDIEDEIRSLFQALGE